MEFSDAAPILEAVAMAEANEDFSWDVDLASELGLGLDALRDRIDILERWGLLLAGSEGFGPMLRNAGRQYLRARGAFNRDVLGYLPHTLDNLHARGAMLAAGSVLVDEFGVALADGTGVDYAREVVPRAFSAVVTDRLAVELFAAAVALISRLTREEPAMCVAEEMMAVELMGQAADWLEMDEGLGDDERDAATGELRGLFELFEDDDVLNMFEMREPGDAAVLRESDKAAQMGIADQSVESWFAPFFGTPATGHLVGSEDRAKPGSELPEQLLARIEPARIDIPATGDRERFRVAVRTWDSDFADRHEFDQMPDAWAYYVEAPSAGQALADVLERFPDGASISTRFGEDEEISLRSESIAHVAIDVQQVGLDQALKREGEFHVIGSLGLREDLLPALAAYLDATFPVAIVAQNRDRALIALSVSAGSHQEAELDLDDVLEKFAEDHDLEPLLLDESSTGIGDRDVDALVSELERFRPHDDRA